MRPRQKKVILKLTGQVEENWEAGMMRNRGEHVQTVLYEILNIKIFKNTYITTVQTLA